MKTKTTKITKIIINKNEKENYLINDKKLLYNEEL